MTNLKFNIEGDETEYVLTFDFNTICDVESATGENLLAYMANPAARTSRNARAMLYALLLPGHAASKPTLHEVGALLSKDLALLSVMTRLLKMVSGEDTEAEEPDDQVESTAPEDGALE